MESEMKMTVTEAKDCPNPREYLLKSTVALSCRNSAPPRNNIFRNQPLPPHHSFWKHLVNELYCLRYKRPSQSYRTLNKLRIVMHLQMQTKKAVWAHPVLPFIYPHMCSQQPMNRFKANMDGWFAMTLKPGRFSFIPTCPSLTDYKYRCFYCSKLVGPISAFTFVFFLPIYFLKVKTLFACTNSKQQ